jgi:competence ComEA-like helix-hairpin-helix protein
MAWLEGLAAKQGVSEEELLTSPDDRPELPPEWTQDIQEETSKEAPPSEPISLGDMVPEDLPDFLQESAFSPAKELSPAEPEEAAPEPETADGEGIEKAGQEVHWVDDRPTRELEPEQVEEAYDIPDWVKESGDRVEGDPEAKPKAEELPDWMKASASAEETSQEFLSTPDSSKQTRDLSDEEFEELPDWLKGVESEFDTAEDPTWIREFGKEVPTFEADQSEPIYDKVIPEEKEDTAPPDETSDAELTDDEEYTWQLSEEEEQPEPEGEPVEKLDINSASLTEIERLPGMGFRKAQTIFSYREQHGSFNAINDLLTLGIDEETILEIKHLVEFISPQIEEDKPKVVEEKPKTGPISVPSNLRVEEAEDKHQEKQMDAQTKLAEGDISDEIIADLEAAVEVEPNDAEIMQALGDAYMRADRLQEALDSYSKAEQLLQ